MSRGQCASHNFHYTPNAKVFKILYQSRSSSNVSRNVCQLQCNKRLFLIFKGARLVSYDDVAEEEDGEGAKDEVHVPVVCVKVDSISI